MRCFPCVGAAENINTNDQLYHNDAQFLPNLGAFSAGAEDLATTVEHGQLRFAGLIEA